MTVMTNLVTETKVLRRFGINEAYQMAMYLLDQYRGTTLSCRYVIPSHLAPAESWTQLKEAVKVAVVDTLMRHPMLQVGTIDATTKTPSWVQLEAIDLTQHVIWLLIEEHNDFERLVQQTFRIQLDDRFPDLSIRQPHWKITIIRHGTAPTMEVLLTWNHHHFDAVGAKVFHEDFLQMLNSADHAAHKRRGLEDDMLRLPQAAPMLPTPIESLMNLPMDFMFLIKVLWEEFRPRFLDRDVSQAAWCPIRSTPYKTQHRAFFVDNATLLAILALCRRNKTTITGLLNGLALIAFSSHLAAREASAFQSSTIVDHRRNLPRALPNAPWIRSDRAVGNYVTQVFHNFNEELVARIRSKLPASAAKGRDLSADLQNELWAASAQNRLEIVRKLETGLRNDLLGVFKWVTDWQQTMGDMAKKTRQFSWLVTNIGVLNGDTATTLGSTTISPPVDGGVKSDEHQKWSIDRAQFGLSAEIPAAAVEISAVSVSGHGMCVGATWADCAVDVKLGESIMADLERWLAQLAIQS